MSVIYTNTIIYSGITADLKSAHPTLKAGEVAICTDTTTEKGAITYTTAVIGSPYQGNCSIGTPFDECPVIQATAAQIKQWQQSKPLYNYIDAKSNTTGTIQGITVNGAAVPIVNQIAQITVDSAKVADVTVNGQSVVVNQVATLGKMAAAEEVNETNVNATLLNKINYITSVTEDFLVKNGQLQLQKVSTDLLYNGKLRLDLNGGNANE